ncbi:hypothetical protein [Saccharopolyspora sp. NPDC002686]|uniref:hypothetical protein n=1 Tax=Saccharopolyspora sp. NPDC002686 TaxID=3154541 RepID=UPI003332A85D
MVEQPRARNRQQQWRNREQRGEVHLRSGRNQASCDRRRMADLMVELEADSRFQAGLRAGELGLPR